MGSVMRVWFPTALLVASTAVRAVAQPVAASFDDLPKLLRIGDGVLVTDKSGETTWGSVQQFSHASLRLAEMKYRPDGDSVVVTGERRVFAVDNIVRIARADRTGREGAHIYPASWETVETLPVGALVTVALASGQHQTYRFGSVEDGALRLVATDGREQSFSQAQVRRVLRRGVSDSSLNGLTAGALVGAGTMFVVTAALYAQCGDGCDAPAPGEMYPFTMAMGAGIGAGAGWLIDKLHRGTVQVFPVAPQRPRRVVVLPLVSTRARGLRLSVTF